MNDEALAKLLNSIEVSNKKTIEEANKIQTVQLEECLRKEINEVKDKIEQEINKRYNELQQLYNNLKKDYEKLEKELRKNNIIIFGLNSENENIPNFVVNTLNQKLEINLNLNDINDAYTIGKHQNNKPIVVKFVSQLKKQEVKSNCKKLKGTEISISDVLTLEERKRNKILRQHLKKAREENLNAYIKGNKLIVNGQEYTAQQLADNEENTDTEENIIYKANSAPPTPGCKTVEDDALMDQLTNTKFETGTVEGCIKRNFAVTNKIDKQIRSSSRLTQKDAKTTTTPTSATKKSSYK